MVALLYKLYFLKLRSNVLDNLYVRVIIRVTNILVPFYYKITPFLKGVSKNFSEKRDEKYIVSLTSFPARIEKVWLTIESILRQQVKADEIILWLYEGEFSNRHSLPNNLLRLKKRGLQIRFCKENLMPHKKYYYAMLENPGANIITIDDDLIFPPDLISNLLKAHDKFPMAICCAITREIKSFNNVIRPYAEWNYVRTNTEPSFKYLTMGGGGTLFPSNAFSSELFNIHNIKEIALRADDLWLKIMSVLNNTKVSSIAGPYPRFFISIIHKNDQKLMDLNIGGGENDKVFKVLMDHYGIKSSDFEKE